MSLTSFQKQVVETEITELQDTLTGDFMHDMDVRDKIHSKEMMLNGVEAASGDNEDCLFCGS